MTADIPSSPFNPATLMFLHTLLQMCAGLTEDVYMSHRLRSAPAFIIVFLGACLYAESLFAQVYKWTDANGVTQYSDRRPAAGKSDATTIKATPAAPEISPRHQPDWKEKALEQRQKSIERQYASQQQEEAERQAALERRHACLTARNRANSLEWGGPLYHLNERGEKIYMKDDERAASMARAKKAISENCPK